MHWLLTRPAGRNEWLAEQLHQLDEKVTIRPALCVQSCEEAGTERVCQQLDTFQAMLFTSINAVEFFIARLQQQKQTWPTVPCFAIGEATARRLQAEGQKVYVPSSGFTSEDLLALPEVGQLVGGSLLLVSGIGGRGLLAPALESRNIKVIRLNVYQRVCNPQFSWPREKVDGVLVTSQESWHCLWRRAAESLRECLVIAGSERIARLTRESSLTRVAASPRDEDMLAAVQKECR